QQSVLIKSKLYFCENLKSILSEKIIFVEALDPVRFFGVHNENLKQIKIYFPKLQIVVRGNELKVNGAEADIEVFQERFLLLLNYYEKMGLLDENAIAEICGNGDSTLVKLPSLENSTIVYG